MVANTGSQRRGEEQGPERYRRDEDQIGYEPQKQPELILDLLAGTRSRLCFLCGLRGQAAEDTAEAPFSSLEFEQGQQEFPSPEVRPQGLGKIEFSVSQLPQEKIADARFSARANQEVRVRQASSIQML